MTSLTIDISVYFAVGVFLAGLMWLTGLGYLILLRERLGLGLADAATLGLLSYPIGLLAWIVASTLVLIQAWLGIVAFFVLLPALVPGRDHFRQGRSISPVGSIARIIRLPLLVSIPFQFAAGLAFGIKWHGPTDTVPTAALGDVTFYVARAVAAEHSVLHFRDLSIAGERTSYIEAGPAILGGAAHRVFGLDLYLFHATVLPVFFATSLVFGFALIGSRRKASAPTGLTIASSAVLATGCLWALTYLVGSPPVALGFPLVFATSILMSQVDLFPSARTLVALCVVGDLIATKVLALGLFALVVAPIMLRELREGRKRYAFTALAGVVLLVGVGLLSFIRSASWFLHTWSLVFVPLDAVRQFMTSSSFANGAELTSVFAEIVLVVFLVRIRERILAGAFGFVMLVEWTQSVPNVQLYSSLAFGVLLVAVRSVEKPKLARVEQLLLATAAFGFFISSWHRDYIQSRTAFVLLLLLTGSAYAAIVASTIPPPARGRLLLAGAGAVAAGATVALADRADYSAPLATLLIGGLLACHTRRSALRWSAVGLVSLSILAGALQAERYREFGLEAFRAALTPSDYEIWLEVGRRVPSNGLVFAQLDPLFLNSYYPAVAGRQLYLAGAVDSRLVVDGGLAHREKVNAQVLRGGLPPENAIRSRSYTSFFAVLTTATRAPRRFIPLYSNRTYTLYRIPSSE